MLETKDVTFALDGKPLIEHITLQFKPGILYGILGPNGSGKSTFLKTLTGIWTPTSGSVYWNGSDLLQNTREEISRTVTLVPQNPQVHFDFSVKEMVAMGRYPCSDLSSKYAADLLDYALHTADVWHLKDRSVLCLSHGERKRVYIARALITESPILLLDEPATSLDISHQLEIWELLKLLIENGKTIIVTSHDLTATEMYCDIVAILNHGQLIHQGKCQEVFTLKLLREVFGVQESKDTSVKHYTLAR